MARARQAIAAKRPTAELAAAPTGGKRSLHTSQAATDVAQLLRARAFCLSGEGVLLTRIAANLQASLGRIEKDAAAWIGLDAPPEGRVALGLGAHAGALGPYSFGFLNNLDGVAPLATPLPLSSEDRPRRGHIAWVVPRRDALPEVVPLLSGRGLGASWLISVGDGDPAEVLRFLALDPATSGILLALGKGVRAQTLRAALGDKPAVLLVPPSLPTKDSALIRAVARRAGAVVTNQLEEWLAQATLLEAAVEDLGPRTASAPTRRYRAAVVVAGAGVDFVSSEVQKTRALTKIPISLRATHSEEAPVLNTALRQAALDAQIVVLCGAADILAEVSAPGPFLRVDPAQPERLRALLRALASPPALFTTQQDDKPFKSKVDRERVEGVLADLPPPLYVGGTAVCDEVLADHDLKRLLNAYGVRVSRQAPANTTTAALRILGKLSLPVELLPAVDPQTDVEQVIAKESATRLLCSTQADVKRQATLLLSHSAHVLLREAAPPAPKLRLQAGSERGLGMLLRLTTLSAKDSFAEAALLPLQIGEAQKLAESLLSSLGAREEDTCDAKELSELLAGLSACLREQALTLDLVVLLKKEPVVLHAAGVLKRQAARATSSRSSS